MATLRPRDGGSSDTIRFEDFHPKSDRQEEEGAQILTLHLPGFDKEQIKITYVHSTRIVRVQGERSIGKNVWGRFNETFPVPTNCVVNKISGKLQEGVLTITMPKQIMTPLIISPKVDVRPPEPSKEPKPTDPPKTGSDPVRSSKDQQEPKPTDPPKTGSDPIRPPKDQQGPKPVEPPVPPKPATPEPKLKPVISPKEDGKKVVSSQTPQEAKQKQEIEETSKATSSTTTTVKEEDGVKTVLSEPRKIIASLDKQSGKKRKELVIADAALGKKERREEKVKEDKDSLLEKLKETKNVSKRSGKELAFQLTEERKALLNAGVAVLVVVALGAYITYSIKSSGNTKN
ncbi:inactive protein RESTRICTED TEV MOVEMENT 2 isoform X2 [Tripterygium wilfordii]|uniref:inactive protein RESTRICTED TEV MOVEMENT 2 isoform X2 n=1 Tax=Tripterygium wilfordii TaxID=458696 RepID=UPI0018F85B04|nr:inactive protein RESTRICTED TEV MOVEMENT 2 isoform X2 [Tripterygium wilfordii]